MIIDQGNLLHGLGMLFIKEFMDIAQKASYNEGDHLFNQGDSPTHFYTLIQGKVTLSIGDAGKAVYTVSHPGEIFGWSSLVGAEAYTASAECRQPTILLKIDRNELHDLLEKHPACSSIFYKKLTEVLGKRLVECYKIIHDGR